MVLAAFHKQVVNNYTKHLAQGTFPWDVVLLTARSKKQAEAFQKQIDYYLNVKKSIPKYTETQNEVIYDVISDDQDSLHPVTGPGGSALLVMRILHERFGEDMHKKRILLIFSGGYSKRLPHYAVVGKLFTSLPYCDDFGRLWTMFELKLATFCCVASAAKQKSELQGLIMVTCADDIILFNSQFVHDTIANMNPSGFVAFAHPSTLTIGEKHGVFVLPETELQGDKLVQCVKYIHKPSRTLMEKENAVVNGNTVFTDSTYFFFPNVTKKLLSFSQSHLDLPCEIDCYGHFLQPLGTHPYDGYLPSQRVDEKSSIILDLFNELKGTEMHVLACQPSIFYHIGTMPEYIDHFCGRGGDAFLSHLGGRKNVSSVLSDDTPGEYNFLQSLVKLKEFSMKNVVIENSVILDPLNKLQIGNDCIISDIVLNTQDIKNYCLEEELDEILNIDDGTFMQTITLRYQDSVKFVTHVIGINDDFKQVADWRKITVFNGKLTIPDVIEQFKYDITSIWQQEVIDANACSLWNAKLFYMADTPTESVLHALRTLNHVRKQTRYESDSMRLSLEDCLDIADMDDLLEYLHVVLPLEITVARSSSSFMSQVDVNNWPLLTIPSTKTNPFHNTVQSILTKVQSKCDVHYQKLSFTQSALEKIRLMRSLHYLICITGNTEYDNSFLTKAQNMLRDIIIAPFVPTTSQFLDLLLVHNVPHEVFDYDKLAEKYNENEITSVLRIIDDKLYCNPARTVHVQFPVRINLAGGWTDTPPYTLAEGGAVLNVAIKINGNNPVNVHAAFTDKPVFRFVMVEQDKTITAEFSTLEDLFTYDDPSTHFALHKAVVCFMFFPKLCVLKNQRQIVYKQDLKKYFFDTLRSDTPIGIEIVTRVTDVPHGSGLGTSSILILACVKAIRLLFDNDDTREAISFSQQDNDNILTLGSERERMEMYKEFDAVLAIEQMLTTGGYAYDLKVFTFSGWQDQIGGALSGVKLIETQPLVELSHNQYSIKLVEAKQDLRDRFLVVYTGKQRMAKVVLTNVVENYIVRVEHTLAALSSLKTVTGNMFDCFERLNSEGSSEQLFQQIGVLLSEVKRLNVCLSPETENQMQHVFDALAPYAHGSCMIGAGAGGFVVAILRGDQVGKREQVVEELRKVDNKLLLCNVDIC